MLTISLALGSPERVSVQLEVTQLLGRGRAQAPGQIHKLGCSLQTPSAEAAGAEDERGALSSRCGATGPGPWGEPDAAGTDEEGDLET